MAAVNGATANSAADGERSTGTRQRQSLVTGAMEDDRPTDRALVLAARRGDHDAAAQLFRRHWPAAWRAALGITGRRSLADDVTADAFERAFRSLGGFDERRPFRPWLHRIVVNRAFDLLRAERHLTGQELVFEPVDLAPDHREGDRALLEAVAELPVTRRAVIVLRYGVGMPIEEIARVLDLPKGTVQSRLARGLDQLRETFEVSDVD